MSLVRTTSGLIFRDQFASFSAWTGGGGNWTINTTFPSFIAYNSPVTLLARTGSGPESGTLREVTPMVLPGIAYILYDAGDNAGTKWAPCLAYTTNGGATWTRLGPQTTIMDVSFADTTMSCWLQDGGDGFYYGFFQNCTSVVGGVPAGNYSGSTWRCAYSDIKLNNWVFVTYGPALGSSGAFDEQCHEPGCIVSIAGSLYASCSTRTASVSGVTGWTTGWDTLTSIGAMAVKNGLGPNDAAAINNNSGTGSRPENPKVFFHPAMGSWPKLSNTVASDASETNANDCYFVAGNATTVPVWNSSGSYRQRMMNATNEVSGAIGYIAPLIHGDGSPILEPDGNFGFYFDGNNVDNSAHYNRDLYQGQCELSLSWANYTAPTPGSATTGTYLYNATSNADFVAEWVQEFSNYPNVNTTPNGELGLVYRSDGNSDATLNGYLLDSSAIGTRDTVLYRANGSGFTAVGNSTISGLPTDWDARNFQTMKMKLVVSGNVHTFYVNGIEYFSLTDTSGSAISSGTHIGWRPVGVVGQVTNLDLRKSDTVTVNGCGAGASVVLRGAGDTVWATATANGSGVANLTTAHYPAYRITNNGIDYTPSDAGLIFGGDVFNIQAGGASQLTTLGAG